MELFDTHCHLDVTEFEVDRDLVLEHSRAQGINEILVPAIDAAGWNKLLTLCQTNAGLYPALGLHPVFIDAHRDEHLTELKTRLALTRPIAVGEIGLDYYLPDLDKSRQLKIFEAQLKLARDADLPVVLHVRKAHDQVISSLRRIQVKGGIVHAFNGSAQQADHYIEMGFKLGFGGTMTYERSNKIRKLAKQLPLEVIVLETDAPDMVVAQHRGERNSPEYLIHCLAALSELRGEPPEALAAQTTRNAHDVFKISTH